jgi:hypothetical protein
MEHIIAVNGFQTKKIGNKYEYTVNVPGQGKFSMLSDGTIKQELDVANQLYNEDNYFVTLKHACVKVLRHNGLFFDDIELTARG